MSSACVSHAQPMPAAVGIGLRPAHFEYVLEHRPRVPFFELHSENLFCAGGAQWEMFDSLRRDYPVSLHGVGLSLGSADRIDLAHLAALRELICRAAPALVSEHVCWGAVDGRHYNDLLPLPYTDEALDLMVGRVAQLQDTLQRRVLVENVSSYIHFNHSTMPEWEFLAVLAARSGCGLLLDVNNLYVNSVNHGFDPCEYIAGIPADAVEEMHLAGFTRKTDLHGALLIDSHDQRVDAAVWSLYANALASIGSRPTLIEWDRNLPEFALLQDEARIAEGYLAPDPHAELALSA
ncbi:MAG: MNIO family bufferin maturase [Rhodanobacteraceae bacterium]